MATRLNRYLDAVSAFDNIEIGLLCGSLNPLRDPDQDVSELMESIKEHGLLEPVIVRPKGNKFEVLAGNRRLRACKQLKHRRVKCIVTDLDDAGAFEVSIAENVQRKTLTPLEEAAAFKKYCEKYGWGSQTQLARKIGKSQEYVSHRMRLLDLPVEAQDALRKGSISATGAEELAWLKNDTVRSTALRLLVDDKVTTKSVRKFSNLHLAVAPSAADLEGPDFERRAKDEQSGGKLLTEAILILRISLVRLDGVLTKAKDTDLRRLLLSKRYALHQLVDELVRMKSGEGAVVAKMPRAPRGYQSISFRKS